MRSPQGVEIQLEFSQTGATAKQGCEWGQLNQNHDAECGKRRRLGEVIEEEIEGDPGGGEEHQDPGGAGSGVDPGCAPPESALFGIRPRAPNSPPWWCFFCLNIFGSTFLPRHFWRNICGSTFLPQHFWLHTAFSLLWFDHPSPYSPPPLMYIIEPPS